MSLNIPDTEQTVVDSVRNDVQEALPESNPFLANSFMNALLVGFSGAVFDNYRQIELLLQEIFPDTATGEFLERWGSFVDVFRNPATASTGNVNFTGTATTVIPVGTGLQSSDAITYVTTTETTIADTVSSVASLTRSGTIATAQTASSHGLGSGVSVTIAGADQTDYNGTFTVTVIAADQFTYTVANNPTTPATGTITAAFTVGIAPVDSVDEGENTNQDNGAQLSLTSVVAGASSTAIVDFDGLAGGTDLESDDDFRGRILDRWQNPVANFNTTQIIIKAREVPGVTRVFVREITPDVGQVTIYFTRDNDENIIPTAPEITAVKDNILTIKPAHTDDDDVIVLGPTSLPVDFTFNSVDPNTSTMQDAIRDNLAQYFSEKTDVGVSVQGDAYRSVIFSTVDLQTGATITSFDLQTPVGDVFVRTDELATLGVVTF